MCRPNCHSNCHYVEHSQKTIFTCRYTLSLIKLRKWLISYHLFLLYLYFINLSLHAELEALKLKYVVRQVYVNLGFVSRFFLILCLKQKNCLQNCLQKLPQEHNLYPIYVLSYSTGPVHRLLHP